MFADVHVWILYNGAGFAATAVCTDLFIEQWVKTCSFFFSHSDVPLNFLPVLSFASVLRLLLGDCKGK